MLSFSSTLTLKTNAVVSGRYVTLYDLAATFSGVSVEKLKNFIVAFAPQPGESYYLDAQSIKIRAEREIKWLKVFEKSKRIKVTSQVFEMSMSSVLKALEEKTRSHVFLTAFPTVRISSQEFAVTVKNVSKVGEKYFALIEIKDKGTNTYVNVTFEKTEVGTADTLEKVKKLAAREFGNKMTLLGKNIIKLRKYSFIRVGMPFKSSADTVKVPVNFVSDNDEYPAILEYKVAQYEEVVVAKRSIPFNSKITLNDVELRRMNVYATSTIYATSLKTCVGKISTWSFEKGQVINLNGLKSPPDVVAGEVLIAYVSYPGMTVTAFVRAMQNGNIGQVIAVRNLNNGYMFYGTVEKGPKICVYHGGE